MLPEAEVMKATQNTVITPAIHTENIENALKEGKTDMVSVQAFNRDPSGPTR
jgi:hypothetical protein